MIWRIITGEYPPQPGGVSDYTRIVARGLAAAGDEVHVWAPSTMDPESCDDGVAVHRMPGRFGVAALARLDKALHQGRGRLLVEYVPQAFGLRGMNLPFALWLYARRRYHPIVMFHEVMFPLERGRPFRHNLIGATNRLMAQLVARAADHIFVSTPVFADVLRQRTGVTKDIVWLPIPSNIRPVQDEAAVLAVRSRYVRAEEVLVAHFSTYPDPTCAMLTSLIPQWLADEPRMHILLLGFGNTEFHTSLACALDGPHSRLHATGPLTENELSLHLSAADLLLQPYPDGVSARRGTLMAALAHGRPVVTTRGVATEPLWDQSGAAMVVGEAELHDALLRMAADPVLQRRYATAAATLYRDCFDVRHTVDHLRTTPCASQ